MGQVELQEVSNAEGLRVNALRHQGVHVVISIWVLEEAWLDGAGALRGDVELKDHRLLLTWRGKEEGLLSVRALHGVLSPALVDLDLGDLTDLERAWVTALAVVNVDHQVGCLASKEEILGHRHLHVGGLAAHETYLLLERHRDVELWVVHDRANRRNVDSLSVANLTLSVFVVKHVDVHWNDLCLEEVSQLAAELSPLLDEVDGLREVSWHLESERNLRLAHVADVTWEAVEHLVLLPHASLPDVLVTLAFVTVVDLLAHIDELELELDAVGRDGLVRVDVDRAR